MKSLRLAIPFSFALAALFTASICAQESYHELLTPRIGAGKLAPSNHLNAYVQNGKLRLSLRDAVLLTLENNSSIQIQETSVEYQKFNLLSAHQTFDPMLSSSLNINRYSSPTYSQLQGVGSSTSIASNALTQTGQLTYSQNFVTGTNLQASLSSQKYSTNNTYDFFNPYFTSTLNLQVTQSLLRNIGRFANTAQIVIARRSLAQSRETFEAEVNDAILQVVNQYWNAVQARGALDVQQKSLSLAEVSYNRDKRALELGALPPLDIYRSQSEVAARKVQVIQASYTLQQAEEDLRLTIGAAQEPTLHAIPLELTEQPQPAGDLANIDAATALSQALERRPEISSVQNALANDETNIRLAHNQLRPDLSFTGFYQSSGLGGNQYNTTTGALASSGGFGSSMDQTFNFGYPGYGGTLTLNLPIKNRGGQARLGNALVSKTRDLYNGRQTREQITREVTDAVQQLEVAKLALAAGGVSFDLAEKSLASDQRKFELGAETNFFVLDSQTKLAQAELSLLQTQISYQVALAAVGHATGDLLTPYHVQIAALSK